MTSLMHAVEAEDWRTYLRHDGYIHFRGLCPETLVSAARLAIDRDLSTNYDPSRQIEYDHRSYCPDLRRTSPVMALLLDSGITAKLDEVIGFDRLGYDGGQIALRKARNASKPDPPAPHIDDFRRRPMVSPPESSTATPQRSSGYISVRCAPSSPETLPYGRAPITFWKRTSVSTDLRHC